MSPDMDDFTRRCAVLNECLRTFITAYKDVRGAEATAAAHARINDLCKVIVAIGGTVTQEIP